MKLTVAYITSRPEPELQWFFESLAHQVKDLVWVLVIDALRSTRQIKPTFGPLQIRHLEPKPTVWQGKSRLTRQDWWAASNARNTAICACTTPWIAFVDDRSVLQPDWLKAIEDAMAGGYAVCGPYQKRHGMTVEDGFIKHGGIISGEDNRLAYVKEHWSDPRHGLSNPYVCPGSWWYGCSTALPLSMALEVNGYDEWCDSISGEDYIFGRMLENNGFPIRFDTRMMIVEDRTPEKIGPAVIRRDKGKSPNDKSHKLLDLLGGCKRAQHQWNLRDVRTLFLTQSIWPAATKPTKDWYDGQPLKEMEPG